MIFPAVDLLLRRPQVMAIDDPPGQVCAAATPTISADNNDSKHILMITANTPIERTPAGIVFIRGEPSARASQAGLTAGLATIVAHESEWGFAAFRLGFAGSGALSAM